MSQFDDWRAVVTTLNRYGAALDRRDWTLLDDVFTNGATADYGPGQIEGREAIVAMIQASLDGCGPTQHLLANHDVELTGHDSASTSVRIRAFHQGRPDSRFEHATLEMLGTYVDRLTRTDDGWRIEHRDLVDTVLVGDVRVLGPAGKD